MSQVWTPERLKKATQGERVGRYQAMPATSLEAVLLLGHPQNFRFNAISVGDDAGQAFLVPLDESSPEVAAYILRAIAAYQGD